MAFTSGSDGGSVDDVESTDAESTYTLTEGMALGTAVRNVLSLIVTSIGFMMVRFADTGVNAILLQIIALAESGAAFINAMFQSPADTLAGAWEFALYEITQGSWAFFGPLTPLVVVGVALGGITMYLYWSDKYDIDSPTLGNLPFVGLDDSGAVEED